VAELGLTLTDRDKEQIKDPQSMNEESKKHGKLIDWENTLRGG
jgi:hypothetical protein